MWVIKFMRFPKSHETKNSFSPTKSTWSRSETFFYVHANKLKSCQVEVVCGDAKQSKDFKNRFAPELRGSTNIMNVSLIIRYNTKSRASWVSPKVAL